MDKITNYKKVSLKPNIAQTYKLIYVKELTIVNNSSTADVEIVIGINGEGFKLLANKTITKNDLYNQNTTIKLKSSEEAEVEIVLNGDIRNNVTMISADGGSSTNPYDDTEIRENITNIEKNISMDVNPKIEKNKNDINILTTKTNNIKEDIISFYPIIQSENYINIQPNNNDVIDLSNWDKYDLLQKRYICSMPLNSYTTITLPQLSDDIDMNPPTPPSHPQVVPDRNKNNFIEVLLQVNSNITLHYQDGGSFEGDFTLTRGKYKFIAKYNLLSYDWQINIYNLDNRIQNYSYTISEQEPNNLDGMPNGHIWYKI